MGEASGGPGILGVGTPAWEPGPAQSMGSEGDAHCDGCFFHPPIESRQAEFDAAPA